MSEDASPEGWAHTTLGVLGRWTSGGTPSRLEPSYFGGAIPWVKTGEVCEEVIHSTEESLTAAGVASSSARVLPSGSLLVAMYGEGRTRGSVGILGIDAATNQACAALIAEGKTREFIPFLFYYLRSEKERLRRLGQGGAQPNVNQGLLKSYPIALPPLNEQRRIVKKLEELLARGRRAKDALDAIPPLLEKLRQSILAAAFRGDLTADWRAKHPDVEPAEELLERIRVERRRKWEETEIAKLRAKGKAATDERWKAKYQEPVPVDASALPELPKGWCWASWAEVGTSQNGRAFPSSDYCDDGIRLLRPGNLHVSGSVLWTESNTKCMPRRWADEFPDFVVGGDELVMNLTAQSLKDEFLGRICMTGPRDKCLLNQRIARLTPVILDVRYVLWFFKSPQFRSYVDTLNTGSLIQHMFTSHLDSHLLPVPPMTEQLEIVRRIAAMVERWTSVADAAHKSASGLLPALDCACLTKAFRGELVEQDPNDEPASVMLERLAAERIAAEAAPPKHAASKRTKRARS